MYLHEYRFVIHLSSSSVDICYPLEEIVVAVLLRQVGFVIELSREQGRLFF